MTQDEPMTAYRAELWGRIESIAKELHEATSNQNLAATEEQHTRMRNLLMFVRQGRLLNMIDYAVQLDKATYAAQEAVSD